MKKRLIFVLISFCLFLSSAAFAGRTIYSRGQTVYVQASHNLLLPSAVYGGSALYVRNINTKSSQQVWLKSVAFYGPDGEFVKEFLDSSIPIGPLASKRFLATTDSLGVSPYPKDGGRPSWVVQWIADPNNTAWVLAPIIESARYVLIEGIEGLRLVSTDWSNGTVLSGTDKMGE